MWKLYGSILQPMEDINCLIAWLSCVKRIKNICQFELSIIPNENWTKWLRFWGFFFHAYKINEIRALVIQNSGKTLFDGEMHNYLQILSIRVRHSYRNSLIWSISRQEPATLTWVKYQLGVTRNILKRLLKRFTDKISLIIILLTSFNVYVHSA